MKNIWLSLVTGLLVAAVWGFFFDLPDGEFGWFVGRLILVPVATVGVVRALSVARTAGDSPRATALSDPPAIALSEPRKPAFGEPPTDAKSHVGAQPK